MQYPNSQTQKHNICRSETYNVMFQSIAIGVQSAALNIGSGYQYFEKQHTAYLKIVLLLSAIDMFNIHTYRYIHI